MGACGSGHEKLTLVKGEEDNALLIVSSGLYVSSTGHMAMGSRSVMAPAFVSIEMGSGLEGLVCSDVVEAVTTRGATWEFTTVRDQG